MLTAAALLRRASSISALRAPTYSLRSAEGPSRDFPCTNRPIQCQHCSLVISSYSMAQHYSDKHSTTCMPEELNAKVALRKHEREHVSQLLKKRKVTSVCAGVTCCPKAPSGGTKRPRPQ